MFKEEFINAVSRTSGISRGATEKVINTAVSTIRETLKRGEKVTFLEFGTFEPKLMSPRVGRNPHTNKPVYIPERVRPVFKASKVFNKLFEDDSAPHAPAQNAGK